MEDNEIREELELQHTTVVTMENLIDRHRKLKVEKDLIDTQLKGIKSQLQPLVEANGNYKDTTGYARMINRKEAVSVNGPMVHNQALIWEDSMDPTLKMVGETILQHCKFKAGFSYLQVK